MFDRETGALAIPGIDVVVDSALTESAFVVASNGNGDVHKLEGVDPPAAVYDVDRINCCAMPARFSICFMDDRLKSVSVTFDTFEFWDESTHTLNVCALHALFPQAVDEDVFRSQAAFAGGRAVAVFESDVGALTTGGASLMMFYDDSEIVPSAASVQ